MRNTIISLIVLGFFTLTTPSQAEQAVVDFDSLLPGASGTSLGPNGWTVVLDHTHSPDKYIYLEDGFKFTTVAPNKYSMEIGAITATSPNYWTGSPSLFHSYGGSAEYSNMFYVTREDGVVFDLLSIDIAAFNNSHRYFTMYGFPSDGSVRVESYFNNLDDSYNSLQTLNFGSNFKNLTGIAFSAFGQHVDNLNFATTSSVPEPQTYAILLAGLSLLSFTTHRRIN